MAVSLERFMDRIVESDLMSRAEVQALIDEAPADYPMEDGQQLARLLVKQKQLTAYQAQQLYVGNGNSLVLGNYVILDKLGQGGMGMVLKAEHKRMERIVALKVLSSNVTKSPEALARFQREVKAAAKLEHPNIVVAHDANKAGGTHFLVMQYVDGSDLSEIVRKKGPLSVDHAVSCILQAARGLEYAHGRGVVHRDIKPANLLLDSGGTVKILDMGLARLESAAAEEDQDQLTGTGQIMGTVDYMAPEQAVDTRTADARADIYALGITLWYLLTGRRAYEGDSLMVRLLAHRDSPVPSLQDACPGVSPELDRIFARMVAKLPKDRYQAMGEVITDLEQCQSGPDSSPSLMNSPGEVTLLNAFLDKAEPTDGAPVATQAVAAKKKKNLKQAQALEATVGSESSHSTDPEAQHVFANLQAEAPSTRRKPQSSSIKTVPAVWIAAGGGGAVLVLLLAATVFFLPTADGTIRVEINDPGIEVAVKGTEITLKRADNGKDVKLSPGDHTLVVQRGDLRFETDKLILKRGEKVTVRVELLAGKLQVRQGEKLIGQRELPLPPPIVPPDTGVVKAEEQDWQKLLDLPVKWVFFSVSEAVSEKGAELESQSDGSLLATGDNPDGDIYRLTGRAGLERVSAIRLEAIPDERLPAGGTGRDVYGNFHLGNVSIERRSPKNPQDVETIPIATAWADYSTPGFSVAKAIDDAPDVGWDPFPRHRERRVAIFELAKPVEMPADSELVVRLQTGTRGGEYPKHNLGRFRLAVTDRPSAVRLAELEDALQTSPSAYSRLTLLGISQSIQSEPEAAAESFGKALEESEDEISQARILAEAAKDAASFKILMERRPADHAVLVERAEVLTAGNEFGAAITLLSAGLAIEPDNPSLQLARGKAHAAAYHWTLAADDLTAAIGPDHPEAEDLALRARVLQNAVRWNQAVDQWRGLLERNPEHAGYQAGLRTALLGTENYKEVIELCQRRFQAAPRDTFNWLQLSSALLVTGDDEGYETFRSSVPKNISRTAVWSMERGLKSCLLKPAPPEFLAALPVADLTASLDQPDFPEGLRHWVYASLALASLRSGDLETVETYAVDVIDKKQGVPRDAKALAHTIRAIAQARQGNAAAARRSLEASAALLPAKNNGDHDVLNAGILRREAEAALRELEAK